VQKKYLIVHLFWCENVRAQSTDAVPVVSLFAVTRRPAHAGAHAPACRKENGLRVRTVYGDCLNASVLNNQTG
jgi:hypothetical protein